MADDESGSLGGKIEEKLGWLTADRTKEAKGKLRQAEAVSDGDEPDPSDEHAAAGAVDDAELELRDDYGELAPEAAPNEG